MEDSIRNVNESGIQSGTSGWQYVEYPVRNAIMSILEQLKVCCGLNPVYSPDYAAVTNGFTFIETQ